MIEGDSSNYEFFDEAIQLLKNPIDILNIGTIMGNGHENYNIKEGEFVLFFYGWNDIQKTYINIIKKILK